MYANPPYGHFVIDGKTYTASRWVHVCSRRTNHGYDDLLIVEHSRVGAPGSGALEPLFYVVKMPGVHEIFDSFGEAVVEAVDVAFHAAFVGEFSWDEALHERIPASYHHGRDLLVTDLRQIPNY